MASRTPVFKQQYAGREGASLEAQALSRLHEENVLPRTGKQNLDTILSYVYPMKSLHWTLLATISTAISVVSMGIDLPLR